MLYSSSDHHTAKGDTCYYERTMTSLAAAMGQRETPKLPRVEQTGTVAPTIAFVITNGIPLDQKSNGIGWQKDERKKLLGISVVQLVLVGYRRVLVCYQFEKLLPEPKCQKRLGFG